MTEPTEQEEHSREIGQMLFEKPQPKSTWEDYIKGFFRYLIKNSVNSTAVNFCFNPATATLYEFPTLITCIADERTERLQTAAQERARRTNPMESDEW